MSFIDLLIHVCIIQRPTPGTVDAYGVPAKSWNATYLTNVPCRFAQQTGKQFWNGVQLEVIDFKVFLEDIDVTEQDRIVWEGNYYKVLQVDQIGDATVNHHHRELQVQILRQSGEPT